MELASQVILGLFGAIVFGLVAGFVDAWGEQRKRDKEQRKWDKTEGGVSCGQE